MPTALANVCGAPSPPPILATAGVGLRFAHHGDALATRGGAPWFEVHPENYLSGVARGALIRIRENASLSLHATGLSLGSATGVDQKHLQALSDLIEVVEPSIVSDHLSWSAAGRRVVPDLLPLPYTVEALQIFCRNVDHAQSHLRRRLLIENPSVYFAFEDVDLTEAEFLAAVVDHTGCGLLLDVNNVVVSAHNLGQAPANRLDAILEAVPAEAIGEIHLAGHAVQAVPGFPDVRIDDHGSSVGAETWTLYSALMAKIGARPTLIEWDTNLPEFAVLDGERAKAQVILDKIARPRPREHYRALAV